MKTFEVGQHVSIPCHIQKGAFSIERLVTVERNEGPYSGFVREEYLWQDGDNPDGYIRWSNPKCAWKHPHPNVAGRMVHFWNNGFLCRLDPKKSQTICS